jgi:hypothetical protein
MKVCLLSSAIVLGLSTLLEAGPLDLKQVSADAKWVAHVDMDALRQSTVVQKVHGLVEPSHREIREHLFAFAGLFGADPRQHLRGITLYGSMLGKPEGVIIAHSDFNRGLLEETIRLAPEYQAGKHGSYQLHSWKPQLLSSKGLQGKISAAFYRPNVMVLGSSEGELKRGLDVLDGKTPGLTGQSPPLSDAVPAGTVVLLRAIGPAEPSLAAILGFLKDTDSVSVAIGEYQGEAFKEARLVMRSSESAKKVVAAAEGARAIAEFRLGSDAEAMKLVRTLKGTMDNTRVTLAAHAPADAVCAQIEKLRAQIAQRRDVVLRKSP